MATRGRLPRLVVSPDRLYPQILQQALLQRYPTAGPSRNAPPENWGTAPSLFEPAGEDPPEARHLLILSDPGLIQPKVQLTVLDVTYS